jgi:hypothetical protein
MIKKWILKGGWLLEIGSNPHSNGDIFSRSLKDFIEKVKFNKIKINGIIIKMIKIVNNWIIIYIKVS